ncbi:MAG TPA: arginase family protein, partial [Vicinamibacteria bacterium]|nr:arginase family protein [Vicinamibacteria bacterium]
DGMLRGLGVITLGLVSTLGWGQENRYRDSDGRIRVAPVKMPYSGARNVPEISPVPDYLEAGGVVALLEELGAKVKEIPRVALTPEEENDYGEWHRLGLANYHLGEMVAENERDGYLTIGLLANCSSLMGVLGGLQDSGPTRRPRKVGLVFIDAHGDFNTPETTLSGMLGGMPVAVSAGMCLRNLRMESGLDPALPTRYIVMAAVRDTDPLEQELIDRSEIEMITVDDIRKRSENIHAQMERLSSLVDLIYIHIDMDVLDPREVSGHPLTVPDGPTSQELADALTEMFRYEKAAALGIASTPSGERDPDGLSLQAAYNLVRGAIRGVKERK